MQFADDMILMGQASWGNLWSIKSILRSFKQVSDLKVNFDKSKIIDINLSYDFLRVQLLPSFIVVRGLFFRFLGIPVRANPRRSATWKLVLDSIRKRLARWKGRNLSIGGWVTLINPVLNSIPLYFFLFCKVLKVIINSMIKI